MVMRYFVPIRCNSLISIIKGGKFFYILACIMHVCPVHLLVVKQYDMKATI